MAEKLCTLRTKGGGGGATQTETVLWTNSSPSSTFNGQAVTLSDNISNYDYIGIITAFNTNGGATTRTIMSVNDFKNNPYPITGNQATLDIGCTSSSTSYARAVYYMSDTQVQIGGAYIFGGNYNNNAAIPLSIIGIKNMGGIRTNEKYESQTWLSVAGNAIPTFSTQGMAKAIWVVRYVSSMAKAVTYSNVNPYTGEIDDSNTYYYDSSTPSVVGTTSAIKFIVTNGQITTSASFSNAAHLLQLSYTY